MSRDLSFLEHKASDSEELSIDKSYWRMVVAMGDDEKQIFLQNERVREEKSHLEWLIKQRKRDESILSLAIISAKESVEQYNKYKDLPTAEIHLQIAESWHLAAIQLKEQQITITDIRKQRKRVQWETRKLKQLKQTLIAEEPKDS